MQQHDDGHRGPPAASGTTAWEITERPIALVDDSIDDQWALRRELAFLFGDMPVISFRSGSALLTYLKDNSDKTKRPWLILLDMALAEMGGVPTLEMLAASKNYADIPVLLISADEDREEIDRALGKGAHGFMQKPLKRSDFVKILNGKDARPLRDYLN